MLTKPIPSWLCIVNGLCLFFYQTLDNLDGRQARKIKFGSPMGQFLDHGMDALSGILELISVCASFNLGASLKTFAFIMVMSILFFGTIWEEYLTHYFYIGYFSGPIEGLFVLTVIQILVGISPDLFMVIPHLKFVPYLMTFMFINSIIFNIYHVAVYSKKNPGNNLKKIDCVSNPSFNIHKYYNLLCALLSKLL